MRFNNFQKTIFMAVFAIPLFIIYFLSAPSAFAYEVNSRSGFIIDGQYDEFGRNFIFATLRHVSDKAYFYVEDEFYFNLTRQAKNFLPFWLNNLADEFDKKIYPVETDFWGDEPNPGIDGDSRITVLLSPFSENAGGYFNSGDLVSKSLNRQSNQKEILYLNANILNNSSRMNSFLSHEFQHLISANQKELLNNTVEDVWLNELRSEYSYNLLGYNNNFNGSVLESRARAFTDSPSDSLTEWKNLSPDYGAVTIFGEYLTEHYGANILRISLQSGKTGIDSLNEAFLNDGYRVSFEEVFRDWLVAVFLNDITLGSNYGYFKDGLKQEIKISPTKQFSNIGDAGIFIYSGQIKDWQGQWFSFSGFSGQKPALEIALSGDNPSVIKSAVILSYKNGEKEIKDYNFSVSNKIFIDKVEDLEEVVFIPYKTEKTGGFNSDEIPASFSFSVQKLDSIPIENTIKREENLLTETSLIKENLVDGSLVRAIGDFKVYVINNGFRRHITSAEIFDFYGHLGFNKVVDVLPEVIEFFPESRLVRFTGGQEVYEIEFLSDGKRAVKQWLNISAEQFTASGRKWESIFIINEGELNFYPAGDSVTI